MKELLQVGLRVRRVRGDTRQKGTVVWMGEGFLVVGFDRAETLAFALSAHLFECLEPECVVPLDEKAPGHTCLKFRGLQPRRQQNENLTATEVKPDDGPNQSRSMG